MIWNNHSKEVPEGAHAFLGASKYAWLKYDEEKLVERFKNSYAQMLGTVVHEFCCKMIRHRIKMSKNDNHALLLYLLDNRVPRYVINIQYIMSTIMPFINDAIGFRMQSEQVLYYSPNCFGTADAISFDNNLLRIHDLKTGVTTPSMEQLEIYAALFCLEYGIAPNKIQYELRIYQNGEVTAYIPEPEIIADVMKKIISADKIINSIKEGE